MNKITKISLSVGSFLVLSSFFAPSISAANTASYYQVKVKWQSVAGASYYNIYYKEKGAKNFNHAVRLLPANSVSYTIGYLRKGVVYQYNLAAVNDAKVEYWWSGLKTLK